MREWLCCWCRCRSFSLLPRSSLCCFWVLGAVSYVRLSISCSVYFLSLRQCIARILFSCCVFYLCRLYVFDLIENSVCNTIKHLLGAMNEYWSEATTQQNAFMVRDSAMKNLVRTQNICEWCKIYIVLFIFCFIHFKCLYWHWRKWWTPNYETKIKVSHKKNELPLHFRTVASDFTIFR